MSDSAEPATTTVCPRDGPATTFEVDLVMKDIVSGQRNNNDFGLVLVVGWPPNKHELQEPYHQLVNAMRSCFDHQDHDGSAYFYPLESLHVTVATLHAFTLQTRDANERTVLERTWQTVVLAASSSPQWPKKPLKLEIDSCQIGSRAGIVLWKETTGGLERMRCCIRNETMSRQAQLRESGISIDTLRIPGIVHTSVLRFTAPIVTDGNVVQERFQENVLQRLKDFFPTPITVTTAVLVCERTPYLHHPFDEHHALQVVELTERADEL